MARSTPLLDTDIVRVLYKPEGEWARECGQRVKTRRKAFGFTLDQLAGLADTNFPTIFKVEKGIIVPRDYLKAAIAYSLGCEVSDIWTPISRLTIQERAKAISA